VECFITVLVMIVLSFVTGSTVVVLEVVVVVDVVTPFGSCITAFLMESALAVSTEALETLPPQAYSEVDKTNSKIAVFNASFMTWFISGLVPLIQLVRKGNPTGCHRLQKKVAYCLQYATLKNY
jgi:membrane-bound ClpP family serine protease